MSTFLQLCVDARRECGIPGSGPTAVTSQSGELGRIVNWVADSYIEIQNRHPDWRWLRNGFTLTTAASDDTYAYGDANDDTTGTAITRFSHWRLNDTFDPPKIYLSSAGSGTQRWLTWTPWEAFKTLYKIGTQNEGAPVHITVDPADNIVLGPTPDGIYVINGDYQKSAQVLAADADTPEMPSQYHMLVAWEAVIKYGHYESAGEFIATGQRNASRLMRQLERNQKTPMRIGRPMA